MEQPKEKRAVSITEVSKAAGVSIATVSRVLNGHPHVSAAASRAVHVAMEKIGYVPPEERSLGRPRGMVQGTRTGNIAVLFPDVHQEALRTTLSGRLLHGIGESLRRRSLNMIVTGLSPDGGMPACMERKQVDGVIIRGTILKADFAQAIAKLPAVWVFETGYQASFDVDIVLEDNSIVGIGAANWLIERGHRRLAFLSLIPSHPAFRVRRLFFVDEAEGRGASVMTMTGEADQLGEFLDRLVNDPQRPTGLFVPGSDKEVISIYRGLRDRGLTVGRDIALISCNNDANRLSALDPALPNIDIQPEAIGRAAVDTLLWRLRHPKEQRRRTIIPPVIVEGVGAAAVS